MITTPTSIEEQVAAVVSCHCTLREGELLECGNCHAELRPAIVALVTRLVAEARAAGANEERALHWREAIRARREETSK